MAFLLFEKQVKVHTCRLSGSAECGVVRREMRIEADFLQILDRGAGMR
jgi:hypothetical protein